MQSDKILATQIYSFLTMQPMGVFLNGTWQHVDKKKWGKIQKSINIFKNAS